MEHWSLLVVSNELYSAVQWVGVTVSASYGSLYWVFGSLFRSCNALFLFYVEGKIIFRVTLSSRISCNFHLVRRYHDLHFPTSSYVLRSKQIIKYSQICIQEFYLSGLLLVYMI